MYFLTDFLALRRRPQSAPRVPRPIMNERIRAYEVFVIDSDGSKLGLLKTAEAIQKAKVQELDLILVAPKAHPPVAKILDYGKWQYEQKKAAAKNRAHGKAKSVKGVRLGIRIAEGDLLVRVRQAKGFIEKGHKLRVVLQFRGREIAHFDLALEKMKEFAKRLEDVSIIEELPKKLGRQLVMILLPSKSKKKPSENLIESPEKIETVKPPVQ